MLNYLALYYVISYISLIYFILFYEESKIKSLTLDSENQLMTSTQDCYSLLTTNTDNPESLQKLQQGRLVNNYFMYIYYQFLNI